MPHPTPDTYNYLFNLGQELYNSEITVRRRKEIAVQLMTIGDRYSITNNRWPKNILPKYKYLTDYPSKIDKAQ